jgi:hypothetical protein
VLRLAAVRAIIYLNKYVISGVSCLGISAAAAPLCRVSRSLSNNRELHGLVKAGGYLSSFALSSVAFFTPAEPPPSFSG